jgi:hypothetical protein
VSGAKAQVNQTTLTFTQNFDSLGSDPTVNYPWVNNSTLLGVYAYRYDPTNLTTPNPVAFTEYKAEDGRTNAKDLVSLGGSTQNPSINPITDRALGVVTQGTGYGSRIGIQFQNNTGQALSGFTFSYRGEQWRNAGKAATVLNFGYLYTTNAGDQVNAAGYTGVESLNFTTPIAGAPTSPLDGNTDTNSRTLTGSVSGLNWLPGAYVWVRFDNANQGGADQVIGIDNVSATFQPVPAPPAVVSLGIGAVIGLMSTGVGRVRARRRGNKITPAKP